MSLDRERFVWFYRQHYTAILRYVRRRVDADAVDDILAETFLVAWRRLEVVPDEPLPWLYGVARRVIANAQRSEQRADRLRVRMRREAEAASSDGVDLAHEVTEGLLIRQALATLSDRDREILILVAWEGLDVKRAAEVLGCTTTAAGVRLHRARRRLSRALAAARLTPLESTGSSGDRWRLGPSVQNDSDHSEVST